MLDESMEDCESVRTDAIGVLGIHTRCTSRRRCGLLVFWYDCGSGRGATECVCEGGKVRLLELYTISKAKPRNCLRYVLFVSFQDMAVVYTGRRDRECVPGTQVTEANEGSSSACTEKRSAKVEANW